VQVYTSFPQTGDNFARLGAPAGASISADIAQIRATQSVANAGTAQGGATGSITLAAGASATDGTYDRLPKKEIAKLEDEKEKLERNLGGIKEMSRLPGALFVIDPKKEHIAIHEATRLGIPVIGLVDTNCDPSGIDYVIPANDDAIRSIRLFTAKVADACIEGKARWDAKGGDRSEGQDDGRDAASERNSSSGADDHKK
jgi:ribosomal protein S2